MGTINCSLYSVTTSTGFEFINIAIDPNTVISYTPTTTKIDRTSPRIYPAIEFTLGSGVVYWVYEEEGMRDKDNVVLGGAIVPPSGGIIKYSIENLAQLNTTGTAWVTHSQLTTPSLASKNYSITWFCEVTNSSGSRWTGVRGRVNGTVYFDIEPVSRRGGRFQTQGFIKNLVLSGIVNIDIQFNNTTTGTSSVRNSQIQIIG